MKKERVRKRKEENEKRRKREQKKRKNIMNVSDDLSLVAYMIRFMHLPVSTSVPYIRKTAVFCLCYCYCFGFGLCIAVCCPSACCCWFFLTISPSSHVRQPSRIFKTYSRKILDRLFLFLLECFFI